MATKKDVEDIKKAISGEEETSSKLGQSKEPKLTDLPGIGPAVAAKLEAAGIYDLMGLAVMSPADLGELAGLGEAAARKSIQAARRLGSLRGTNQSFSKPDFHPTEQRF